MIFSKMKTKSILCLAAGWLVPGLGHFIQKKYWRAAIFFCSIFLMILLGILMGGRIYSFQTENPLTILAFFSDIGLGAFYFFSKLIALGAGNLRSISYEFGTAYIAGAGLLNFLVASRRLRYRLWNQKMMLKSHLLSMIIYAALVCIVLSLIRRDSRKARIRYALSLFVIMVAGALLFGWFMYLFI